MDIWQQFVNGMKGTLWYEYLAVFAGIASVWFSRKENILVYPVGLISTIIYIFISMDGHLLGEASVNIYYTIMSIYGWWLWTRKDRQTHETVLHVTYSNGKEWTQQLLFFAAFYVGIYFALTLAKKSFAEGAIPWADAFASATAYTGMWLMAKKKVENWWWWIVTDIASVPLYFIKGYVFTSFQFLIFTIMAIGGLLAWMKKAQSIHKGTITTI